MKTIWLQQTRIGISLYDMAGEGYLREADLENYITELIPSLCKVSQARWLLVKPFSVMVTTSSTVAVRRLKFPNILRVYGCSEVLLLS